MPSTPNATAENGNTDQIYADALLVSSTSISSIPQPTPTASLRRSNKQKKDGKKVEKKDAVCSIPSTTCQRCHVWTLPQIFRGNFELIFYELDDT
nr:hypothetical protein Iba_chr04bCG18110 [Ipomoea batatas]